VRSVVRRQLYAVLLFQTVVLMSAALDVIARSGATPARAVATQSRKTLAPMIGVGTSIADASERSVPPAPLGPGHPHPPSRVRVDVVFDESISPKLHATAMKEVAGIWSAYGVDVQAAGAGEPGRNGAIRLTVTIGEHPDPKGVIGTLGSIGFVDDVPEPAIVMYPNTIATLVSDAQYGGFDLHTPSAFRDFLRARVFGRALAHEIGHFLLRSRHHSDAGLMRAMHRANDLVAANRHRFELTTNEVTRLESVTLFLQSSSAMNRP